VSASVIAYVSLHGSEYRLVRRADEEDDEPLLVIERRTTDALDAVCWSAVASTTTFDVLEAYALGVGVRPAHAPEAPRIGEELGDVLRDVAAWCDRHGVSHREALGVSVSALYHDEPEIDIHVHTATWVRLTGARPAEGGHQYAEVDGVRIVAIFASVTNHSCTTPGCLDGEACAVLREVPDGHRI
jgi:hypothetical protein